MHHHTDMLHNCSTKTSFMHRSFQSTRLLFIYLTLFTWIANQTAEACEKSGAEFIPSVVTSAQAQPAKPIALTWLQRNKIWWQMAEKFVGRCVRSINSRSVDFLRKKWTECAVS